MFSLLSVYLSASFMTTEAICPKTYTIGPDTSIVNDTTYYKFGYELNRRVLQDSENICHQYNSMHGTALVALENLELKIYKEIQSLYSKFVVQDHEQCYSNHFTRSVLEYLEDFKETSLLWLERRVTGNQSVQAGRAISGNPLTVYRMVRRFRVFIQPWRHETTSDFQRAVRSHIRSVYRAKDGPLRMDFQISMMALISTQFQLNLKTEDIAEGMIRGVGTGIKLRALHCFDIGVHSFASGMFAIAVEWLELTITKIKLGDNSVELERALHWLKIATTKHDEDWCPVNDQNLEATFFKAPLSTTAVSKDSVRVWTKQSFPQLQSRLDIRFPHESYAGLCNEEIQLTEKEKSKLFCWLETQVHPTWTLGPLKAELLSRFPLAEIVQYHDVIKDREISKIKANFRPAFAKSSLVSGQPYNPKTRFSLTDTVIATAGMYSTAQKLEKLSSIVTGLKINENQTLGLPFQTNAFAPGGHIAVHGDGFGFENYEDRHANRVATILYYLDSPEKGGFTVFPHLVVRANPAKGSAILWYNLDSSGVFDKTTLHGACPVEFGHRWVGTKWILYADQYHMKCDREKIKRIETLMNGKSKYA